MPRRSVYICRRPKCGSTEAMCFLGWYFQQENNTELALNYLKEAVKENDKEACTLLANYYLNVTKQKSKAVYWYTRAAKQGHIPAQHALASCLEYGIGVPKKDEKNALLPGSGRGSCCRKP